MKRFLLLLALTPSLALAQTKVPSNAQSQRGGSVPVTATAEVTADGYLVEPGTLPAANSVPLIGTVTSSGATATSGAVVFAGGSATFGPLVPQLGRDIGLKSWSTNGATCTVQMVDSIDGGVTRLPLTIFDTQIGGPYTVPVNSVIATESIANSQVYVNVTAAGGTCNLWAGQ